jgi:CBS domain-containing protein
MWVGGVMRTRLVTAAPEESAGVAMARMLEAGVGSIIVCDGPVPVGIFTERDVLRLAGGGEDFREWPLADVMTRRPLTVSAQDGILEAAKLMGERRIRHLPVVEGEFLVGVVSIRDVFGFLVERLWSDHDEAAREAAHALLTRPLAS